MKRLIKASKKIKDMLMAGDNVIDVHGDDVYETIDELTGKFANCYLVTIYNKNGKEELFTGYINTNAIAAIFNGEQIED